MGSKKSPRTATRKRRCSLAAELTQHLRQVVLLAWSRSFGLDDHILLDAAEHGGTQRVEIITDDLDRTDAGDDGHIATFLRLFSVSVVYGPRWLVEAARPVHDEVLAVESTLIRLATDYGDLPGAARSLGETTLYYADDSPQVEPSTTLAVSFERDDVDALERACPADDVTAAAISHLDSTVALVPDDGQGTPTGEAVAASGFEEWENLVAGISTLVHPDLRLRGLGSYATAVTMDEAFAAGLIPQWRAPMGHRAAERLADRLGFVLSGSQTTVLLD